MCNVDSAAHGQLMVNIDMVQRERAVAAARVFKVFECSCFFLLEEGEGDVEMNVVVFYLVDFICLFAHLCVQ